jgi:hypothetical protein
LATAVGVGPAFCDQNSTYGPGEEVLVRHQKLAICQVKDLLQRLDDAGISRDAAGEYDWLGKFSSTAQVALEISRKCETQSGYNVAGGRGLLLKVNHIALGEDGASASHSRHAFTFQRQLPKFTFDVYTQAVSLLVEEGASAGCANSIKRKIADPAFSILCAQED